MMSEFTVYTSDQLSNEAYHEETEHMSGSSLAKVFKECLAKWKYDEAESRKQKQKPLVFGTVSHAQILEPERFDLDFFRMPDLDIDYPPTGDKEKDKAERPITSVAALQSWLKDRGVAGRSSPDAFILIEKIKEACGISGEPLPLFWHEIMKRAEDAAGERQRVPGKDFDLVKRMREVLFNNEQYHRILTNSASEISIFGEFDGIRTKVRLDKVTDDAEIWDYKTTQSAQPEKFARLAYDLCYPLKMALQYHMFKGAYGQRPNGVVLLAQEKEPPFLPLECRLTRKTLLIGTAQLRQAIAMVKYARENDMWTGYNAGLPYDLDPPFYIEKQYEHLFKDANVKK